MTFSITTLRRRNRRHLTTCLGVLVALLLLFTQPANGQDQLAFVQSIKGKITDVDSREPLIGATIRVLGSNPLIGAVTDINGLFRLNDVPVGRVTLQVSYIGYQSSTLPNVVVNSGKEVVLEISLQESAINLEQVVVTADETYGETLNEMSLVSSRSISTEEMSRITASFNDPALITTSFAGVASSGDGGNDIIVRGNSPKYLQWRIEGMPISNPNHFADQNSVNGTTSALNTNLLATSDFYTGAFTAEFGDALSGVYDIRFRSGNNEQREFTLGAGLLGTDLTVEGPFSKNYEGSYLVNYRYSTATALGELGLIEVEGDPVFQDAAFKFNFPTEKLGTFSLFGLGAMSEFDQPDVDPQDWTTPGVGGLSPEVTEDFNKKSYLANVGLRHVYGLSNHNFLESRIGFSVDGVEDQVTQQSPEFGRRTSFAGNLDNLRFQAQVDYHHKIDRKNKLQAGANYNRTETRNSQIMQDADDPAPYQSIDFNEGVSMARSYLSWKHRVNNKLTLVGGLHNTNVLFNNKHTVEPRLAATWQASDRSSINLGYGMHSAMERVHHYFAEVPDTGGYLRQPNKDLGLLKAHHFVAGYTYNIAPTLQARVEAYYQHLYDLPVASDSSYFATINEDLEFEYTELVNEGTGANYGIEITLQKYFSDHYYFMVNGTWFQSNYTALDGVKRSTRFEGDYLFNILGGKEFAGLGRKQNKTLAFNARLFVGGGKKILPVLRDADGNAAVDLDNGEVWDTDRAFEGSIEDIYKLSFSTSYKWEKPKATHELLLNIDNLTDNRGKLTEFYDANATNGISHSTQFGVLPNLMYRIYF